MTSKNNRTPLLYYIKLCASFQFHRWIQTEVTVRKHSIRVKIGDFCPVWPWNVMVILENNRAPLLYYIELCASFQSHGWIQTGVTYRKRTIRVKIGNFFVPCELEIWWMTLKTIGYLFYVASSFVHHFIAVSEFKLELQSGNAQFGSKSTIFFCRVTLKFDGWPWKTIWHLF